MGICNKEKTETKKISIIVPVYNVEQYLNTCIESIAIQTYQNLEIILVDDGATDSSGALCDSWAEKDSRIRVIHKENGGLSDARNAGIEAAHGAWYMFVDSDDTITPDTIQSLWEAAESTGCEIAVCNMARIYDDGETEPFYVPTREQTILRGNERFETLKQPSACNKLFRAELFQEVRFPKGKFYEDTYVYHLLALQAKNVVLTGQDGYYYLSRRGSILGQEKYTDRYFDMIEAVWHRAVDLTANHIPYYAEEACLSLYAVTADGEKHLKKTNENREKVAAMRQQYRFAYEQLIKDGNIGMKQKLRLFLLRYAPTLHAKIY